MARCPVARKALHVFCDTREQQVLRFPPAVTFRSGATDVAWRIETTSKKMIAGDYTLACLEARAAVERKGSLQEVWGNLLCGTKERRRQLLAFDRLACLDRTVVLLDFPVATAFKPTRWLQRPWWALDELMLQLVKRDVGVLWVPPSKNLTRTGEVVLKWLLAAAEALDITP